MAVAVPGSAVVAVPGSAVVAVPGSMAVAPGSVAGPARDLENRMPAASR